MQIVVCSVIIQTGSSFLLVREKSTKAKGKWGLPGGKLEGSESLIECAKRETLEETGIRVESLTLRAIVNKPISAEKNNVIKFVFYTHLDSVPRCDGELENRLYALDEIKDLNDQGMIRGSEIYRILTGSFPFQELIGFEVL